MEFIRMKHFFLAVLTRMLASAILFLALFAASCQQAIHDVKEGDYIRIFGGYDDDSPLRENDLRGAVTGFVSL